MENLLQNQMIHTIRSLIYLTSFITENEEESEYNGLISSIYDQLLEISEVNQRTKINNLSIRRVRRRNGLKTQKCSESESFGIVNSKKNVIPHFNASHLLPFHRMLIVGDGDFSFTLSVLRYLNQHRTSNMGMISSCYPSVWSMVEVYSDIGFVVDAINGLNGVNERGYDLECKVLFGIDATKLDQYRTFGNIDCILWNLPQTEQDSHDIDNNRILVELFLKSCSKLFARSSMEKKFLFLSLHCNKFNRGKEKSHRWKKRNATLHDESIKNREEVRNQFATWNVGQIAASLGFRLERVYRFDPNRFEGYRVLNHLTGAQFKGFNEAFTYEFKWNK